MGTLSPGPSPNLEDKGLLVWPVSFDLSGMDGLTRSLLTSQHNFQGYWAHRPPLHDKVVVLEEEYAFVVNCCCWKLVNEARNSSGTQGKGNIGLWKPLPSNGSDDVSVDTSLCVTVNCNV